MTVSSSLANATSTVSTNRASEKGETVNRKLNIREDSSGNQLSEQQRKCFDEIKNITERSSGLPDKNLDSSTSRDMRTNSWLQGLGLQLPSDTTDYGSVGIISNPDGSVNMDGVSFESLLKGKEAVQ